MGKVRQLGRLVNRNRRALAEFEIVFKLLTFLGAGLVGFTGAEV